MTQILVTGATGIAGRFITENLLSAGYEVKAAARRKPDAGFFTKPVDFAEFSLDPDAERQDLFDRTEYLVHCAFDHIAGRYRGGEGDDPETFTHRNLGGTIALFRSAKRASVKRAVFLSSRAVYGTQAPGARLTEETAPHPDTLYGETKLAAERAIASLADDKFLPVSLRVTGIYGPPSPGRKHKWNDLFADYLSGKAITPRIGTEVHGDDFAAAVRLVLEVDRKRLEDAANGGNPSGIVFNVSDILLDRHDLLAALQAATGCPHPLPPRGDAESFNIMDISALKTLGWRPKGALDLSGMI